MGKAYLLFAKYKYRRRYLEAAEKSFGAVLKVFTSENHPRRHAQTQAHIGDTYTLLAALKPRSTTQRSNNAQKRMRYQNMANRAYRVAESFGIRARSKASSSATPVPEEEKKE